jgi:hypothetical protein
MIVHILVHGRSAQTALGRELTYFWSAALLTVPVILQLAQQQVVSQSAQILITIPLKTGHAPKKVPVVTVHPKKNCLVLKISRRFSSAMSAGKV